MMVVLLVLLIELIESQVLLTYKMILLNFGNLDQDFYKMIAVDFK